MKQAISMLLAQLLGIILSLGHSSVSNSIKSENTKTFYLKSIPLKSIDLYNRPADYDERENNEERMPAAKTKVGSIPVLLRIGDMLVRPMFYLKEQGDQDQLRSSLKADRGKVTEIKLYGVEERPLKLKKNPAGLVYTAEGRDPIIKRVISRAKRSVLYRSGKDGNEDFTVSPSVKKEVHKPVGKNGRRARGGSGTRDRPGRQNQPGNVDPMESQPKKSKGPPPEGLDKPIESDNENTYSSKKSGGKIKQSKSGKADSKGKNSRRLVLTEEDRKKLISTLANSVANYLKGKMQPSMMNQPNSRAKTQKRLKLAKGGSPFSPAAGGGSFVSTSGDGGGSVVSSDDGDGAVFTSFGDGDQVVHSVGGDKMKLQNSAGGGGSETPTGDGGKVITSPDGKTTSYTSGNGGHVVTSGDGKGGGMHFTSSGGNGGSSFVSSGVNNGPDGFAGGFSEGGGGGPNMNNMFTDLSSMMNNIFESVG